MKKLLLSICMVCFVDTFGVLLYQIKNMLYQNQAGLMKKEQYMKFIDPYCQQASSELKVVQYCLKNDNDFCDRYARILTSYVALVFSNMLYPELNEIKDNVVILRNELESKMKLYKKEIDNAFDVQEELDRTVNLVKMANEQYYKNLNTMQRFFVWWNGFVYKTFYA